MNDVDLIKSIAGGGIGVAALYVVYLIVRLFLDFQTKRNTASDDLALKTIEVVGKDSEALGKMADAMREVGTGLQGLAKGVSLLVELLQRKKIE